MSIKPHRAIELAGTDLGKQIEFETPNTYVIGKLIRLFVGQIYVSVWIEDQSGTQINVVLEFDHQISVI